MKQELLEEKVVEILEANKKFKSQLEEMVRCFTFHWTNPDVVNGRQSI